MRLLLDTCTFLWIIGKQAALSNTARQTFIDPNNETFLSVVSEWEIGLKYSRGYLPLPEPPWQFIPAQRKAHVIRSLPLTPDELITQYSVRTLW